MEGVGYKLIIKVIKVTQQAAMSTGSRPVC